MFPTLSPLPEVPRTSSSRYLLLVFPLLPPHSPNKCGPQVPGHFPLRISLPSRPSTLLRLLLAFITPCSCIQHHHAPPQQSPAPSTRLIRPVYRFRKRPTKALLSDNPISPILYMTKAISSNDHHHDSVYRFHPLNPTGARAQARS